jgi:hypothetical protein
MRATTSLALAALATAALTATAVAGEPGDGERKERHRMIVVHTVHGEPGSVTILDPDSIEGDHLRIDDLDSLLPGEERAYTTEEGREVTVTRKVGDRYSLTVEGKTVEIGGELEAAAHEGPGKEVIVRRHAPADGEASTLEAVVDRETVISMATAGDAAELGEAVVIEIVGPESDERKERRVIVLRAHGSSD